MFKLSYYERYNPAELTILKAATTGLLMALAIHKQERLGKAMARTAAHIIMSNRRRYRDIAI